MWCWVSLLVDGLVFGAGRAKCPPPQSFVIGGRVLDSDDERVSPAGRSAEPVAKWADSAKPNSSAPAPDDC